MPLPKDDRIAFSLQIVSADALIKSFNMSQARTQAEIDKLTKLDNANKNLFDPPNLLVNSYQAEQSKIDSIVRTTITETDIQNSAKRILQNHFFPNDINTVVPSLAASHNVWTKIPPFAITYAIGKNYTEGYGATPKEADLITPVLNFITAAGAFTNIQLTTGQFCTIGAPDIIAPEPDIQTLVLDITTAVNALKSFLLAEVALITVGDPNTARQTQNNTAINNINNVIIPALNTWLAYPNFNTAHGQTTCAGFNSFNSNILAPTKLHSTQLSALQTALNARTTFRNTRSSQVLTNLGTIVQNISTGEITSSTGLYGQRFGFLLLRLNALDGSLSKLNALLSGKDAQNAIKANILSTKNTYLGILPTSLFKAPGNGTASITLNDTSFLSAGDTVYVIAEGQEELQRAVKSVSNDTVILNDIVPAKYRPAEKARLYKDLT